MLSQTDHKKKLLKCSFNIECSRQMSRSTIEHVVPYCSQDYRPVCLAAHFTRPLWHYPNLQVFLAAAEPPLPSAVTIRFQLD